MTNFPVVLPPASQEAEEAVIGSILISPAVFPSLQMFLRAGDFWTTRYQIMWKAFERLTERGDPIELTSVMLDLENMGQFDDIGGYAGLTKFIGVDVNTYNVEAYARLVHRLATRRALMETSDKLRQSATDEGIDTDLAIARAEQHILSLRRRQMAVDVPQTSVKQATLNKFEKMMAAEKMHAENPNYVIGVRTGVTDLDRMLDGLRAGITTLAGATGSGKTALALQVVRYASQFGLLRGYAPMPAKTLFFSGEMTEDQMINRMLSSMTGVPARLIERGSYTKKRRSADDQTPCQKELLEDALHDLGEHHQLTFEDTKRMNTSQIRQRVRTMVLNHEMDLLVLDGLLQIEALSYSDTDTQKHKSYMEGKRRDFIEMIMNELEDIALTYELPILLTHQLSRAPSGRAEKRPILSDLAEANFVEQKSAVILFLYRDAYYNPGAQSDAAEVICAKNRHGETGTVHQIFNAQYTRFSDADRVRVSLAVGR